MSARRRWTELSSRAGVVDALCAIYEERGGERYDESVSQTAHAVQSASRAEDEGASPALVVAALLHDVGHLLARAPDATRPDRDLRHEEVAARFLGNWYGPEVTEPVRHHVAAKRYLCAVEPSYADTLSPASLHSLELQGGVMTPDEVSAFVDLPGAAAAVRLRRWDDLAKDPERATPGLDTFRPVLLAAMVRF